MISDWRCSRHSLKSSVRITEWERTLHRAVGRAIKNDKPSGPALNTVTDDIFVHVSRAIKRGDSGPAGFDFLLQVLSRQFDNGDATCALSELPSFGVHSGTPYADYYRTFPFVFSGDTGSESAMTPGLGLVMEIVRLSVNKQFPQLMPSLYPGELATRSQHFGSVDVMWLPLGTLENINTLNINGAKLFAVPAVSEGRVSAPSGPRLPPRAVGRGARHCRLLLGRRVRHAIR